MENSGQHFLEKYDKTFSILEYSLLTLVAISFLLGESIGQKDLLFIIALGGLGTIYFLLAFKPVDIPEQPEVTLGFRELLGWSILPKVSWMATSIGAVGILFYLIGGQGFDRLLGVSAVTILTVTIIQAILVAIGIKYTNLFVPMFFRSIPVMIIS